MNYVTREAVKSPIYLYIQHKQKKELDSWCYLGHIIHEKPVLFNCGNCIYKVQFPEENYLVCLNNRYQPRAKVVI